MKLGWLVKDECNDYEFFKDKPRYYTGELIQIVYSEIVE